MKAKKQRGRKEKERGKGGREGKSRGRDDGGVDFDAIQNEEYVAPRTAEDDAFIDDDGVADKDKWANMSDDEDGKVGYASEAEETEQSAGSATLEF